MSRMTTRSNVIISRYYITYILSTVLYRERLARAWSNECIRYYETEKLYIFVYKLKSSFTSLFNEIKIRLICSNLSDPSDPSVF